MPFLAAAAPAAAAAGGATAAGTGAALGTGAAVGTGAATGASLGGGLATAGAVGGGTAAGGGLMSSIMPAALGSMMSTLGNSQQGIPMLLNGAAEGALQNGIVPQVGSSMAEAVPGMGNIFSPEQLAAIRGPGPMLMNSVGGEMPAPLMPPGMGEPPPLASLPEPPGTPGKSIAPPGFFADSGGGGMIPKPSALKEALAASAQVQDMMRSKHNPSNAPAPNFYIPQGVKAPQFGSPPPRGPGPLERYVLMLRR